MTHAAIKLATIAATLSLLSAPALADTNNHGFSNTLGKIVKGFESYCTELQMDNITADEKAKDNVGTETGKQYADQADAIANKAAKLGCSWA